MASKPWSLQINVAGVAAANFGGSFDRLPTGPYAATIVNTEKEPGKDGKPDNVICEVQVTEEGAQKGKKVKIWMSTDFSKEDGFQRRHFKTLLLSVAKDPAVLEKGTINIGEKNLEGKAVTIYCEAAPEGAKTADGKKAYDNINFITREQYEKLKASAAQTNGASAAPAASNAGSMEIKGGSAPASAEAVTLD